MSIAADALEQRCRTAWPELPLDADTLEACAEPRHSGAEAIHQPDLYLSRACLAEQPGARELLERHYLGAIDGSLEALAADAPEQVETVRDRLRTLLFRERLLGAYGGRGPLQAWINIWAVRLGLQLWRERESMRATRGIGWVWTLLWPDTGDAVLDSVKRRHREFLADLLRRAATDLVERERMILQLHWLEHLDTDEIAARLEVRPATVTLGLANARRLLSERGRRLLVMSGACAETEQPVLDRLIRAQLELALGRDFQATHVC